MNVRNIIIPALAGVLGLGLGFTAGNAGDTETVEQPAVPDICIAALSRADSAMDYAGQGFSIMSDAFYAISVGDSIGLSYAADEIQGLTPSIESSVNSYRQAADECRALAPAVAG